MGYRCKQWTLTAVLLASSLAFAGKKEEKGEEGRLLLDRAVQLSDIRAAGAWSFRLKVSFRVINENATTEGMYLETWLSPGQWRSETTLGEQHRIVVANERDRWTEGGIPQSMTGIGELGFPMNRFRGAPEFWKADKLEDRDVRSSPTRCIETRPSTSGSRSALCFSKDKGLLVAKAVPTEIRDKIVESVCEYRDYQEFGAKVFPRHILCFDARRPVFEESVVELSVEHSPDSALFTPPVGATKSANCQGITKPPTPMYAPDPELPRQETPKNPVDIDVLVQADGKVGDLKVARSVDEAFDKAALNAVQKWRFKPATCDGVAIPMHISVAVDFRFY